MNDNYTAILLREYSDALKLAEVKMMRGERITMAEATNIEQLGYMLEIMGIL